MIEINKPDNEKIIAADLLAGITSGTPTSSQSLKINNQADETIYN